MKRKLYVNNFRNVLTNFLQSNLFFSPKILNIFQNTMGNQFKRINQFLFQINILKVLMQKGFINSPKIEYAYLSIKPISFPSN